VLNPLDELETHGSDTDIAQKKQSLIELIIFECAIFYSRNT
jgi:hypothetical protein